MRALPFLLVLSACTGGPEPSVELDSIDVVISEFVPTVVTVSWESDQPGASWVEWGVDGDFGHQTPVIDDGQTTHSVVVYGMAAGSSPEIRAVTEYADGMRFEGEGTVTLDVPPQALPRYTIEIDDGTAQEGYLLFNTFTQGDHWVVILDREGNYVWFWNGESDKGISRARPSRDGQAITFGTFANNRRDDIGDFVRVSLDGSQVTESFTTTAHHDFVELQDGTVAWLGFDYRDVEIAGAPESGELPTAADVLYTADAGATDSPTELFNFFDDYVATPWWICDHMQFGHFLPTAYEWIHGNSLMEMDDGDAFGIMSRYLDAVLKIDAETGDVAWQMGGDYNDFTLEGDGQWWSHGHMSHIWEGGMLVFDNRNHIDDEVSRVVEYAFDENNKSIEQIWEFWEPDDAHLELLGDARRLPDGNTLIAWSAGGRLDEVTADGEVVWRAGSELGWVLGRVDWVADLYALEDPF